MDGSNPFDIDSVARISQLQGILSQTNNVQQKLNVKKLAKRAKPNSGGNSKPKIPKVTFGPPQKLSPQITLRTSKKDFRTNDAKSDAKLIAGAKSARAKTFSRGDNVVVTDVQLTQLLGHTGTIYKVTTLDNDRLYHISFDDDDINRLHDWDDLGFTFLAEQLTLTAEMLSANEAAMQYSARGASDSGATNIFCSKREGFLPGTLVRLEEPLSIREPSGGITHATHKGEMRIRTNVTDSSHDITGITGYYTPTFARTLIATSVLDDMGYFLTYGGGQLTIRYKIDGDNFIVLPRLNEASDGCSLLLQAGPHKNNLYPIPDYLFMNDEISVQRYSEIMHEKQEMEANALMEANAAAMRRTNRVTPSSPREDGQCQIVSTLSSTHPISDNATLIANRTCQRIDAPSTQLLMDEAEHFNANQKSLTEPDLPNKEQAPESETPKWELTTLNWPTPQDTIKVPSTLVKIGIAMIALIFLSFLVTTAVGVYDYATVERTYAMPRDDHIWLRSSRPSLEFGKLKDGYPVGDVTPAFNYENAHQEGLACTESNTPLRATEAAEYSYAASRQAYSAWQHKAKRHQYPASGNMIVQPKSSRMHIAEASSMSANVVHETKHGSDGHDLAIALDETLKLYKNGELALTIHANAQGTTICPIQAYQPQQASKIEISDVQYKLARHLKAKNIKAKVPSDEDGRSVVIITPAPRYGKYIDNVSTSTATPTANENAYPWRTNRARKYLLRNRKGKMHHKLVYRDQREATDDERKQIHLAGKRNQPRSFVPPWYNECTFASAPLSIYIRGYPHHVAVMYTPLAPYSVICNGTFTVLPPYYHRTTTVLPPYCHRTVTVTTPRIPRRPAKTVVPLS